MGQWDIAQPTPRERWDMGRTILDFPNLDGEYALASSRVVGWADSSFLTGSGVLGISAALNAARFQAMLWSDVVADTRGISARRTNDGQPERLARERDTQ